MLRSGHSSELWTSRDLREGNEVKGRRGSRREGGRSRCTAGRDALSRTEAERNPQAPGEMFHMTEHRLQWTVPFFRTETSRNLTKRFRKHNNSDLKHQRVI